MGDRINVYFKQEVSEGSMIMLYSHWSGYDVDEWLSAAVKHARARWSDPFYGTRMIISHILKDVILDEFGYGISVEDSLTKEENGYRVVDFTTQTVYSDKELNATFEDYVNTKSLHHDPT